MHRIFRAAALLPACWLLVAATCAHAEKQALVLRGKAGNTLLACPAPEGFVFGIRFVHSVAKSPVEEWFVVRRGVLHLDKTVYHDFGAGLPHNPEPGQTMRAEGGRIVMSGYDRPLPEFTTRVGRVAEHALLLPPGCGPRTELRLDALAPPGSPITFTLLPQEHIPHP